MAIYKNLVLVPQSRSLPSELSKGIDRDPPAEGTRQVVVGPFPGLSAVVRGPGDLTYLNETDGLRRLAWGCFYLLTSKALLAFPTTSVSHPSNIVQVDRNTSYSMRYDHATLFPFYVEQARWHRCVVPVLTDPNYDMSLPKNKSLIEHDQMTLIGYIEEALREQFREERYIP